jgi:hypothetical protein
MADLSDHELVKAFLNKKPVTKPLPKNKQRDGWVEYPTGPIVSTICREDEVAELEEQRKRGFTKEQEEVLHQMFFVLETGRANLLDAGVPERCILYCARNDSESTLGMMEWNLNDLKETLAHPCFEFPKSGFDIQVLDARDLTSVYNTMKDQVHDYPEQLLRVFYKVYGTRNDRRGPVPENAHVAGLEAWMKFVEDLDGGSILDTLEEMMTKDKLGDTPLLYFPDRRAD